MRVDSESAGSTETEPLETDFVPAMARAHQRIIAVGGGKGGAGRSLLTANLGMYLAQTGKRTVLIDLDLGGANLHTFVGVERPQKTLGDLLRKRVARIQDCVVETPIPGLGLISAEGDPLWMSDPRPHFKRRLLQAMAELVEADVILCDLPAGSGLLGLDVFTMAHVGLLVVVPEPTSAENAYRFLKSAFLRKLRSLQPAVPDGATPYSIAEQLGLLIGSTGEGGIPAPLDVYDALQGAYPEHADAVAQEMQAFHPALVINQTRSHADSLVGDWMCSVARKRLGISIENFGAIDNDDNVWQAVRKRKPLLTTYPECKAVQHIEQVARKLFERERGVLGVWKHPSQQNLYEVIEADPGASDEEIRRAVRRMREIMADDSMVVRGLYSPERLHKTQRQIEEAYDTLLSFEKRKRYDLMLFPEGVPARAPHREPEMMRSTDTAVSTALVTPGTEFSGALLQQLREARGLSLYELAAKTKVSVTQLRALEADAWKQFPALVYVRGFLAQYAKSLQLDVTQVTRTYLARFPESTGQEEP